MDSAITAMSNGDVPPLSRKSRLNRLTKLSHRSSPRNSFSPSDILPQDSHKPNPKRPQSDLESEPETDGQLVLGALESDEPVERKQQDFTNTNGEQDDKIDPSFQDEDDGDGSYDLKPPPPKVPRSNVEAVTSRFFSADHLDLILRDPTYAARFRRFLDTYKPQHASALKEYIALRKAFAAVEYANAIAHQIPRASDSTSFVAANYDDTFGDSLRETAEALIEEALPAYLTHRLVSTVTESLVKDITGNNAPLMKELIPNLAEVYCISDPSREDNPIVYASEEFYSTTQYSPEYVLGRNCRFLQGPDTSKTVVQRMKEGIAAGEETCETLLNYRRDGSPFVNLLMIAPLYDNKGEVRYFLGAQIDVTPLIEGGRVLDSFAQLLRQDDSERRSGNENKQGSLFSLGELGEMLDEREVDFIKDRLMQRDQGVKDSGSLKRRPTNRRVLSSDEDSHVAQGIAGTLWPDENLGHSGRLPGVYRNYLLVRPHPSLRITFTSPALRIPGLLQTKFLDRIGGHKQVREGLVDALSSGTSVTAKVSWLTTPASNGNKEYVSADEGKPRWIHCTPLLGSDDKVGVWMIVLVEEEEVTGILNRQDSTRSSRSATPMRLGEAGRRSPGNELYADYLKGDRNQRPQTSDSQRTTESAKERREVDDQFRDF